MTTSDYAWRVRVRLEEMAKNAREPRPANGSEAHGAAVDDALVWEVIVRLDARRDGGAELCDVRDSLGVECETSPNSASGRRLVALMPGVCTGSGVRPRGGRQSEKTSPDGGVPAGGRS
jgi:hypothetical protein